MFNSHPPVHQENEEILSSRNTAGEMNEHHKMEERRNCIAWTNIQVAT